MQKKILAGAILLFLSTSVFAQESVHEYGLEDVDCFDTLVWFNDNIGGMHMNLEFNDNGSVQDHENDFWDTAEWYYLDKNENLFFVQFFQPVRMSIKMICYYNRGLGIINGIGLALFYRVLPVFCKITGEESCFEN